MTDPHHRREQRRRTFSEARIRPLGQGESDDLSDGTTAEERIALVWTLSARMWELTGRPLPGYARSEIPVRIVRRE